MARSRASFGSRAAPCDSRSRTWVGSLRDGHRRSNSRLCASLVTIVILGAAAAADHRDTTWEDAMAQAKRSKLVAVVFDDPYKAEEARAALHRMGGEGLLEIDETALIVKYADGQGVSHRTRTSRPPGRRSATSRAT